jgi:hypothetical protein
MGLKNNFSKERSLTKGIYARLPSVLIEKVQVERIQRSDYGFIETEARSVTVEGCCSQLRTLGMILRALRTLVH